jgi:hypothetical protein
MFAVVNLRVLQKVRYFFWAVEVMSVSEEVRYTRDLADIAALCYCFVRGTCSLLR